MIPSFPVYLFDIDGTLLDSALDICGAVQQVLAAEGRDDVPFEFLKGYIGFHLLDLFQDVFPEHTPEQIDHHILRYRTFYPARGHRETRPYQIGRAHV